MSTIQPKRVSYFWSCPKVIRLNSQEVFNWENARKSKNENNAFCLPYIRFFFFAQSSQYQIWKANAYSILTNGNRTCTQLGSQSFMVQLILNINFIKRKSKIGYPWVSNWDSPNWKLTVITTTPWSTYSMMGSLKLLYTFLQVLEQSWRPFISLKLCKCSQNPNPASRVASKPNKNQPPFA